MDFRRIFCRCSSTIFDIAESMLMVCCMLGRAVASSVFGRVVAAWVDMCFAELSGALEL